MTSFMMLWFLYVCYVNVSIGSAQGTHHHILNGETPAKSISLQKLEEFMPYFIRGVTSSYVDHHDVLQLVAIKNSSFYQHNLHFFRAAIRETSFDALQHLQAEQKMSSLINIRNLMMLDAVLFPARLEEGIDNFEQYETKFAYLFRNQTAVTLGQITKLILEDDQQIKASILPSLFYPNVGMPKLRPFNPLDMSMKYPWTMRQMCKDQIQFGKTHLHVSNFFVAIQDVLELDIKQLYRWLSECVDVVDKKIALYFASIQKTYIPVEIAGKNGTILDSTKSETKNKLTVDVYIEALCPDVEQFLFEQLHPIWSEISPLVDINFITFGKATANSTGNGTLRFECQHGMEECQRNKLISCAMEVLPMTLKLPFLTCFMKSSPSGIASECARKVGFPDMVLEDCYESDKGTEILYSNGLKTLNLEPKLHFVPTVTVDGIYDEESLHRSLNDFHDFICESYSTKFKDSLGISTPPGCKTSINVFVNSFNKEVQVFFNQQLLPTWRKIGRSINIHIVSDENLETNEDSPPCEEDTMECQGHIVVSCIARVLPQNEFMEIMFCVMSYNQKHPKECALEQGIEWQPIQSCIARSQGKQIASDDTDALRSSSVSADLKPFVEINGVHNQTFSDWATSDLYLLVCDSYGMYKHGDARAEGPIGCPVRVEIYMESLCSDTKKFFAVQLMPAWSHIQYLMDVHIVPYGKANVWLAEDGETYNFECQHGMLECRGNKVMSCVVEYLPTEIHVPFIACMLADVSTAYSGPRCAEKLLVDWDPLEKCSMSDQSSLLLYQNGLQTMSLKPRLFFVPTITLNGYFDKAQLQTSIDDFHNHICRTYRGISRNGIALSPKGCKARIEIFFDISSKSSRAFLLQKLPPLWNTLQQSITMKLHIVSIPASASSSTPTSSLDTVSCTGGGVLVCALNQLEPHELLRFLRCYLSQSRANDCEMAENCAADLNIPWKKMKSCVGSSMWRSMMEKNNRKLRDYPSIQKFPALILNGVHVDTTAPRAESDFQKIICSSFYDPVYPAHKKWRPAGCPVSVSFYTEAMCPAAKIFFLKQLFPVWKELKDIVELTIIPFGKATSTPVDPEMGRYDFDCQNGPSECHANILMSCIIKHHSIEVQMEIFHCLFEKGLSPASGPQCVSSKGLAWSSIEACIRNEGETLLYQNGLQTKSLIPKIFYVPTVTVNGYYNKEDLRSSLRDLKSVVCKTYLSSDPKKNILIPDACKVKVRVLFGSMDIHLKEFFTFTLEQFEREFAHIIQLEFIPLLGLNERTTVMAGDKSNCTLPQDPCYQSKVLACFFSTNDTPYQMEFLACLMLKDNPNTGLAQCAQELLVDMAELESCAKSPKADAILRKLLVGFPRKWVQSRKLPIVLVGKRVLTDRTSLQSVVCKSYGGSTHLCPSNV